MLLVAMETCLLLVAMGTELKGLLGILCSLEVCVC